MGIQRNIKATNPNTRTSIEIRIGRRARVRSTRARAKTRRNTAPAVVRKIKKKTGIVIVRINLLVRTRTMRRIGSVRNTGIKINIGMTKNRRTRIKRGSTRARRIKIVSTNLARPRIKIRTGKGGIKIKRERRRRDVIKTGRRISINTVLPRIKTDTAVRRIRTSTGTRIKVNIPARKIKNARIRKKTEKRRKRIIMVNIKYT